MILALFMLIPLATNLSQDPVTTVRAYLEAVKALDAERMQRYLADDYTLVESNGKERAYNRSRAYPICDWERVMHTKWSYKIIGVNKNSVSVVLTEKNDYFTLLGLGFRTQITVYIVESGKIKRGVSKYVVEERGTQGEEYSKFKTWLLNNLERPEPDLVNAGGGLMFDGKSAPRMLYWLRRWNRLQESNEKGKGEVATLRAYLDALKALDHSRMEKFWAEDVTIRRQDGTTVSLDRKQTRNFREFERTTNTKWRYKIIGAQDGAVTVLLTEQNDFYDLLGTGTRTQVDIYTVRSGRIESREIKFLVHEKGEEDEVYSQFKAWLFKQLDRPEPDLARPEGTLIFNGKSAPRMLYWLRKWNRLQRANGKVNN